PLKGERLLLQYTSRLPFFNSAESAINCSSFANPHQFTDSNFTSSKLTLYSSLTSLCFLTNSFLLSRGSRATLLKNISFLLAEINTSPAFIRYTLSGVRYS